MSKYQLPPGSAVYEILDVFLPVRKANYVIKFFQNPCAAPWYVYVELFIPAFAEMFITLIEFGRGDILRFSAGRPQRRIFRKLFAGAKRVTPKGAAGAVKIFWQTDLVVQRALFYWMIADLTIEGLYKWTTMVNETIWCSGEGILQAEVLNSSQACHDAWLPFVVPDVLQNTAPWFYDGVHCVVPPSSYHVVISMKAKANSTLNPRLNFQMRVRVTSGGVTLEDKTEPIDLKVGEPQDVMLGFGFRIFPATTGSIAWSWRIDTAGIPLINIDDCQLAISDDGPF